MGRVRKHRQHRGQGGGNPRSAETGAAPNARRVERHPDAGAGNRVAAGRIGVANGASPAVIGVSGDVDDLVGVHRAFDAVKERIIGTDGKCVRLELPALWTTRKSSSLPYRPH